MSTLQYERCTPFFPPESRHFSCSLLFTNVQLQVLAVPHQVTEALLITSTEFFFTAELGAADDERSWLPKKKLFLLLFCLLTVYKWFCIRKHDLP